MASIDQHGHFNAARQSVTPPTDRVDVGLIGTGRIRNVRVRGEAVWDLAPDRRFRTAEISAYWSASDRADWEGALAYDAIAGRGRARVSHIRRFNSLAAAASIEAGTDGSFAVGINLNFSLDSSASGLRLTSQRLATTGSSNPAFGLNDNVSARRSQGRRGTLTTASAFRGGDRRRAWPVMLQRLTRSPRYRHFDSGDPTLTPRRPAGSVPSPGVAPSSTSTGAPRYRGCWSTRRLGFEGLDVELLDAAGKVCDDA